ncbi:hypothetical protein C9940_00630 [Pseudidiomarina aestuarii]|uniref:Initiator Rep protein WH1 domain-containing protein n=1 Tax=Pseudidiomarina aestuarii TaxID=624146 RepID=A0A2T4CZ77_9GAMM|nr:hypothetical protein C9940_00630 [Pseudidiomarina aestuarii]
MGAAIDCLLTKNPEFLSKRFGKILPKQIRYYPRILHNKIGMARHIARASWNVNLREKRLLMLAISKIDYTDTKIQQEWGGELLPFGTVIVTASDYQILTGTSRREALRVLNDVAIDLSKKVLKTIEPDKNFRRINFTASVKYFRDESLVKIEFNREFFEFLTLLTLGDKPDYISYTVSIVQGLGLPGWRLFELLKSYHDNNAPISIDTLKFVLDQKEQRTADFIRRVLNPAILELREVLGWELSADIIRRGRKIKQINFSKAVGCIKPH